MWAIDNQTPFAAERTFVRDRDGAEIWLIAVRGTFDVLPHGGVAVSENQEPVALAPQYLGKPGASSLRCDTDLPRTKPGTDIVLNATAFVPDGRASTDVEVAFRVGNLRKALAVSGDRTWERRLGTSVPGQTKPFSNMPIVYERAYGGRATEQTRRALFPAADCNPIGVGLDSSLGAALPNVRYPGTAIDGSPRGKPPAGFGAISCAWMPRRQLAGTYDEKWQRDRQPLVPEDFQDDYFYSAPSDQRIPGYIRGGETVELSNLTPSGFLTFQLPRLAFGFRTSIGGDVQHHRANLHTVLIEPDKNRLIMVWHSALPCHHTLYTLKRTVVFQKEYRSAVDRESLVA